MATGTNVFISYTSDTKPLAENLALELRKQGLEPWVDFMNLQPDSVGKKSFTVLW